MNVVKKVLKINASGELVQYNEKLKLWELVSKSWDWSDIDPDLLEQSKENWNNYKTDKKQIS